MRLELRRIDARPCPTARCRVALRLAEVAPRAGPAGTRPGREHLGSRRCRGRALDLGGPGAGLARARHAVRRPARRPRRSSGGPRVRAGRAWRSVAARGRVGHDRVARRRPVRVLTGQILVDVNHTVATDLATGIQRVARETVRRWVASIDIRPWRGPTGSARCGTSPRSSAAAAARPARARRTRRPSSCRGARPSSCPSWRPSTAGRGRLLALARWSGNRTGVIGFDCVPLTSAETSAEGFAAVFFGNLAAVRHFDRVAAISGAAATEYEGWRRMLGAVG